LALATFLHLLRPARAQEHRALRGYRAEAEELASRVGAMFAEWVRTREIEPDNGRLANIAAVNRWELLRMATDAEQLEPPRAVRSIHNEMHNAVLGSARAFQLLANGYRSHSSDAVCDGQALLVTTVEEIGQLVGQLQARF
jgi:hypothetical protein